MDFRTVHWMTLSKETVRRTSTQRADFMQGTNLTRLFMQGTNLTRLPEEIVASYDDGTSAEGELSYMSKSALSSNAQALGNLQRVGFIWRDLVEPDNPMKLENGG